MKKHFGLSVANYIITSKHVHLLVKVTDGAVIARSIQLIAGGIGRGMERVFEIDSLEGLHSQFEKIVSEPGHTFTVLELEPLREKSDGVPIDDIESKFRFRRYIEEGRHQSLPPSRNLSAKSLGRNLPRMADYSCSQENSRRNLVNNPG